MARGCGDAGPVGVTASGCQRTHTVQQRSRTTLQAERHFTSGVSLQELNPTLYSFWHCRGQEEPSSSPGQSGFGIFPHYLPRGQPEDLPVAVLFIPAGYEQVTLRDARRNSPSTQRGAQEICAFLLNYSALLATRPSVHFHPTQCLVLHRPRTTATLLISDFFLWCFFLCVIFVDMKTLIRVLKVRRGLNENGWVIPCFLLC